MLNKWYTFTKLILNSYINFYKIRDASEKIAEERRAFVEAQVEEKAKMIEKTKKFFSPNETKNICGDITAQVAKCYL